MGDAAHVHSPAGGQGMNTGLVDACVLGQLLGGRDARQAAARPIWTAREAAPAGRRARCSPLRAG